ncbi:hypothetical protein [Pseudomethylobacillus aquaticus]|nr:hypothetical protein [Pseudomethylobacillus aquaticus]
MQEWVMKWMPVAVLMSLLSAAYATPAWAEQKAGVDIEAVTAQGDKVILQPNGRWKFVDTGKAAEADQVAKQYVENQGCPNGTQGGFLGFGRCIAPGDKDFNRGSMGGKGR